MCESVDASGPSNIFLKVYFKKQQFCRRDEEWEYKEDEEEAEFTLERHIQGFAGLKTSDEETVGADSCYDDDVEIIYSRNS